MRFNTETESLTEAYHTLYDAKDRAPNNERRYVLYLAIQALSQAMKVLNVPVPKRYDGDGRPTPISPDTTTEA